MTPAQEARLPRYARAELDRLRRDLTAARAVAKGIVEEGREAGAWVDPYGNYPRAVAGRYARIRLAKSLDSRRWVDVRRTPEGLFEVMASGGLSILPRASNVVEIEVQP